MTRQKCASSNTSKMNQNLDFILLLSIMRKNKKKHKISKKRKKSHKIRKTKYKKVRLGRELYFDSLLETHRI